MATFIVFHEAMNNIGKGLIDFDSQTFKAALTNVAPSQSADDEFADITEISAGNGYAAGGFTLAVTWVETGAGTGIWRFDSDNPSWTASGGDIAAHQYLVVYENTSAQKKLLGFVNMGSSAVIANGNTRTWNVAALVDFTVP